MVCVDLVTDLLQLTRYSFKSCCPSSCLLYASQLDCCRSSIVQLTQYKIYSRIAFHCPADIIESFWKISLLIWGISGTVEIFLSLHFSYLFRASFSFRLYRTLTVKCGLAHFVLSCLEMRKCLKQSKVIYSLIWCLLALNPFFFQINFICLQ